MLLAGSALGASPPQNLRSLASVHSAELSSAMGPRPPTHPPLWKPKIS